MLDDLIAKHSIDGQSLDTITALLGPPDFKEGHDLLYTLVVDFGMDIDPVYLKYFVLKLDEDSIVIEHSIREIHPG